MRIVAAGCLLLVAFQGSMMRGLSAADDSLKVTLRSQTPITAGANQFHTAETQEIWAPQQTAIIICDVWDYHHCLNAVRRVEEFGPRLNEVVQKLRDQGVTVIHAPSDCMEAYADHPGRLRAQQTPLAETLPPEIQNWCNRIPSEEAAVYPIDQSDGGEDDDPQEHAEWAAKLESLGRNPKMPWKAQSDLIAIDSERDFISDKGDEVWSILESRGIQNVILAGVHTNMCVLGRPFGLRRMAENGKHVVLLRDMTDTMYNPKMWPYVSHFTGTDLIISHIERFVCPTLTSDQILGGEPFRFSGDQRPHVVMLLSEDEYETGRTLTNFAAKQLGKDFRVSFVYGKAEDGSDLPGIDVVDEADILLVSVRRRALPQEQLEVVRKFIASGKPAIGVRTASHAFSLRDEQKPAGRAVWPEFDAEVWGGHYTGHHGNDLATTVELVVGTKPHPILAGIENASFASRGSLYQAAPLASGATLLANGTVEGHGAEPVAWTFTRADGGKSFYTSLGHPEDFESLPFVRMLVNAVYWAADRQPPADVRLLTFGDDIRRRWTPIHFNPHAANRPVSISVLAGRDPVWFRCGVSLTSAQQGHLSAAVILPEADDYSVWLNGDPCWKHESTSGTYEIPAKALDRVDANLLVIRAGDEKAVDQILSEGVVIRAAESSNQTPTTLDGIWEVRVGDDPAWSSPALPAKFALPTAVYFETSAS